MTERVVVVHVSKRTGVSTDLTTAGVGGARYTLLDGTTKQIPSGSISFDEDKLGVLATLEGLDDLEIYVEETGVQTKIATALLIPSDNGSDVVNWNLAGYEHLTTRRRASGVHLGKTGTQLFKDLVDEYLPELTYDDDSIPAVVDEALFDDQMLNAKVIQEIFDTIAEGTERVWKINENKKIFLRSPTFTPSGYTIDRTLVIGRPKTKKITSQWMTIVRVEGASTETQYAKTIPVTDPSQTEYLLPYLPSNVKVSLVPAGSTASDTFPLRGALEGSQRVDDDGIEYTYNPAQRKITFLDAAPARAIGDAVYADFTLIDQIVSEQVNPLAYAKYFQLTGPPEVNRLVTTQTQADELAQTLADARGEPPDSTSFGTQWSALAVPGYSIELDDVDGLDGSFNVVEMTISWGATAPTFSITLDNINYRAEDTLKRITNRLRQLEEKDTANSTQVKKTIPLPGNIGIEIFRVHGEERLIGNAFTFDLTDLDGMFDNSDRYMDGQDGGGELDFSRYLEIWNVNDKIKIHFNDEDEWDAADSTAILDPVAATVSF